MTKDLKFRKGGRREVIKVNLKHAKIKVKTQLKLLFHRVLKNSLVDFNFILNNLKTLQKNKFNLFLNLRDKEIFGN